jgi:hypothetical protein
VILIKRDNGSMEFQIFSDKERERERERGGGRERGRKGDRRERRRL